MCCVLRSDFAPDPCATCTAFAASPVLYSVYAYSNCAFCCSSFTSSNTLSAPSKSSKCSSAIALAC